MPISRSMRWVYLISSCLLLVAGFTGFAVYWYRPRIEKDLLSRTSAALRQKQVAVQSLSFEGRDAKLVVEKGETSVAAEVRKVSEGVFGVRAAKVDEVLKQDPSFQIVRIGPRLKLTGKFALKETVELFNRRAAQVFGEANVSSQLEFSAEIQSAPFVTQLAEFISVIESIGPEARLTLSRRNLVLSAFVPDEQVKDTIEKRARELTPPQVVFVSELRMPERQTTASTTPDLEELLEAIRLNFEYDSTRLTQETQGNLELLKETLREFDSTKIKILGYTDSKGTEVYNDALSRRRATYIQKSLTKMGFAKRRFASEGRGERNPVANNETEEGRQLNRRVVFEIVGGM